MKKGWIWAVLLIALLVVSACRPVEDDAGRDASGAAEDLGACLPEEEACVDESALSATPEEETAPAEEPEPEETPVEEPAATDTEVSESPPIGDDPFAVQKTDWVLGPDDAFMTLIEYGDFQ